MNHLKRLCLRFFCPFLAATLCCHASAQDNKNIQSVPTIALSQDALKIGKTLRHSALEFRSFRLPSTQGPSRNIYLANDGHPITIFQKYPLAEHVLHNIFRFQRDDHWGLADDKGNVIIAPVYTDIWLFEVMVEGVQKTFLWLELPNPDPKQRQGFRSHYQALIDVRTGLTLNREPMYSLGISAFDQPVPSGLIPAQPVSADGPHGYMDLRTGEMAIAPQYLYAAPFQDQRATVIITPEHAEILCKQDLPQKLKKSCQQPHTAQPPCHLGQYPYDPLACQIAQNMDYYGYGVLDTHGNLITRFDYDYIQPYQNQYAVFQRTPSKHAQGKLGYMDIQGNEILYGYTEALPFQNPYATYVKFPSKSFDLSWNYIDTKGTVYAIHAQPPALNPPNESTPNTEKPRLNFVTPFEIHGASHTEHSTHLDNYILEEPIVSHTGEYIASILVNENGHIIWPKHWDHPCTYTYDIVVWPKGSCDLETWREQSLNLLQNHFLIPGLRSSSASHAQQSLFWVHDPRDFYDHLYFSTQSWLSQLTTWDFLSFARLSTWIARLDLVRLFHRFSKTMTQIQTYQIPALAPYLRDDAPHYVRIGFGPKHWNPQAPRNPGVYSPRHAYGILNADTGKVVFRPGKYPVIRHTMGNLFVFAQEGLMGLMDAQENVLIPPRFLDIALLSQNSTTVSPTLHPHDGQSTSEFFPTQPQFTPSPRTPGANQPPLIRISVLDPTHARDFDAMHDPIPVIQFYYDAATGTPKPELTDKGWLNPQNTPILLTHTETNPRAHLSPRWFVERIQTVQRTAKDPEPVTYEVLVDLNGTPVFPEDLKTHVHGVHFNADTAIVRPTHPLDAENPLELRCLNTAKIAETSFASFMPASVHAGAACVSQRIPSPQALELQAPLNLEDIATPTFQHFITSCDLARVIEVESCTSSHVTPFVQGSAWIKAKGSQTFQRIDTQGRVIGTFEIHAEKAVYDQGVYRFSMPTPSPEHGWKYPEIIVSQDGDILWPRHLRGVLAKGQ